MDNSYITYDPIALAKQRYGTSYGISGNPGGTGWIDPTAVKSPGTAYINSGANNTIDSNFYNKYPTNSSMNSLLSLGDQSKNPFAYKAPEAAAFQGSNSSNFGDKSLPEAPGGSNTATGTTPSASALHSLANRKPTLANSWGGWSNQTSGADTQGQGNNFTYFSRFA